VEAKSKPADASRVVVIGAGVAGAVIAFGLASRGVKPIVVDAAKPGGGLSNVSFSWINGADKKPRRYSDLNRRALEAWGRLARSVGATGLRLGGELRWAATEPGGQALRARVATHAAQGYPMRWVDSEEFALMEPDVAPGEFVGASFSEAEGHVDTCDFVTSCLDRASRLGASVRSEARVVGLEFSGHEGTRRIEAVLLEGHGREPCDLVVIAAGAASAELARMAGRTIPMKTSFGATLVTEPVDPIFRSVAVLQTARDREVRVSIRQLSDGRAMLHGLGSGEGSLGRTDEELDMVLETARAHVPGLRSARISEIRRGERGIPADGLPVWGFVEEVPSVYVATMHNAITLTPLIGELSALEIAQGVTVDELEDYRISRFG
jgi:glycine/D-amino acid oxidase-like deaminating enzyme